MSPPYDPPTFSLDPLHPTVLRCGTCGQAVATVDPAALDDAGQVLTARQAAAAWPEQADVIHAHGCGSAEDLAETVPTAVFVYELLEAAPERNGIAPAALPESGF